MALAKKGEAPALTVITVRLADLGAAVVNTTKQCPIILPFAYTKIHKICVSCHTATTAPTVDIFNEAGTPATILDAPIAVAADAVVDGAITASKDKYHVNSLLSVRCVTAAGTGALEKGVVTLLISDESSPV